MVKIQPEYGIKQLRISLNFGYARNAFVVWKMISG